MTGRVSTGVIRVLVVDDQPVFRRAASAVVAQIPGFELVGEAETGEQGVTLAAGLDAQVVLMDLRLPGIDGSEATRRIVAARPDTVVVLVSSTPAAELASHASRCGAAAFVQKEDLEAVALESLCRHALPAGS